MKDIQLLLAGLLLTVGALFGGFYLGYHVDSDKNWWVIPVTICRMAGVVLGAAFIFLWWCERW